MGEFLKSAEEVGRLVVGSWGGRPVYLPDVASVQDGPEEVRDYVFFVPGPAAAQEGIGAPQRPYPAVTLSIGKQKGANAVVVTDRVLEKIEALKGVLIPSDVHVTVTRNYGETAQEKSNEVLEHVLITVIAVTTLISLFLGSRACGPRNALPFPALCRKICSRDSKPRKQFTMLQCIHDMGDSTLRENNTRRPVLKVHI